MTIHIDIGDLVFAASMLGAIVYGLGHFFGERSGEKLGKQIGEMDERIRRLKERP